jgi:oligopeptide transport system ATP-binding protein
MHIVFQDPYSSLNPRMTCGSIVGEPLRLHGIARGKTLERRVAALFDAVGLRSELRYRFPHELSGGQRQRVGLARALSVSPSLLVADEPVSALDVSVQAAVLNLVRDLQRELGFACLFISHDLATVEFLCDRVAVMYLGKLVEVAARDELFANPRHPYTQALLSAALLPDPELQRSRSRIVLEGDIPSPLAPPSGCRFRTRCPLEGESAPRSTEEEPPLVDVTGHGHLVACHLVRRGAEGPRLVEPPAALAADS